MGIPQLWKFLEQKNKEASQEDKFFSEITMKDLEGEAIAVDAMGPLHEFMKGGGATTYILKFRKICKALKEHKVRAVFVWDNTQKTLAKQQEDERRKEQREINKEMIDDSVEYLQELKTDYGFNPNRRLAPQLEGLTAEELQKKKPVILTITQLEEDILQRNKNGISPTEVDKDRAKQVIESEGFHNFIAPGQGEAFCASLNRLGLVKYTVSSDGDSIPFGASLIIRGFNSSSKAGQKLRVVDVKKALEVLKCTQQQMVEIAILCKNDFAEAELDGAIVSHRLKGIGIATAYKEIVLKGAKSAEAVVRSILYGRANKKRKKGNPEFQLEDLDGVMKDYSYAPARAIFVEALDYLPENDQVLQIGKLLPKYMTTLDFEKVSSLARYGFEPTIVEVKRKAEEDIDINPKKQKTEGCNCCYLFTCFACQEKEHTPGHKYCSKCNRMKLTNNQDGTGESFCIHCDVQQQDQTLKETAQHTFMKHNPQLHSSTPLLDTVGTTIESCEWRCDICCREQICEACRVCLSEGVFNHCNSCEFEDNYQCLERKTSYAKWGTGYCKHRCLRCSLYIKKINKPLQ